VRREPCNDESTPESSTERAETVRRLFQEHNRALVRFLRARLHSEQDAHEVAQEAYVKLLQLEKPGALSFLRSYLFKTASNLAIDRMRARAVRHHVDMDALFEELEEPLTPEREVLAQQEVEGIAARLERLPAQCSYAFAMHVLLDRPVREIAAELKLTERAVRYYIVRALIACRKAREAGS